MSSVAEALSWPGLAGPYAGSAAFFVIGAVVVASLLRPDPKELARVVGVATGSGVPPSGVRPLREILGDQGVQAAMATMTLSQAVMTMLMVITSLHMSRHAHSLANISGVMSAHVLGMFAFAMVAGRLADRWGRGQLIAAGGAALVLAALGAAPSVGASALGAGLFLLGLGWNFCYVGASTLLSDRLTPAERARVQGLNDAMLTGTAALGSVLSGVVFSVVGYPIMGLVCAAVALVPLSLGWRLSRGPTVGTTRARAPGEQAGPPVELPEP
jgi:MFS family permease